MDLTRRHFSSINSTNTWAKEHTDELPRDKITLITADTQTGGRGRFNRQWKSPPGENIYATFCLCVEKPPQQIGNLPQVLAVSAAAVLKNLHFQPELKWPNDILLSGKKVGGILAETTSVTNQLCVIIGIGLNINMPLETLKQIDQPATSLIVEAGHRFSVETVLQELQAEFTENIKLFFSDGFSPFLETYREYVTQNPEKTVRFHDNRKIWEGTLHSINEDGSLCLRLPGGEIKTFIAGEIL